jgi:hypothetical protein
VQRGNAAKTLHLENREVAHSDGADFLLLQQRKHRFRGFFDHHQWIGPMNLINVDVVGSKPA